MRPVLGWDEAFLNSAAFDVMLHLGTLVALLIYFWRDVLRLVSAGWAAIRQRTLVGDPDRRLAFLLLLSVIPAALLGATLESFFDTWFRDNLLAIPAIMVAGALALWAAEKVGTRLRGLHDLRFGDAIAIGAAQALSLFPGASRSGVTLTAGLFLGLRRDDAARFAFLMGIPIIAGAGLWKMRTLVAAPPASGELTALVAGMLAAAISGLIAIRFLLRYLRTNSTMVFVVYRLVFAAIVTAVLLAW